MLFNSVLYFLFFSLVFLLYWQLGGRLRQLFLIGASLLFYAVWGLEREGLIGLRWTLHFFSIVVINYLLVRQMFRYPELARRKLYMRIAVVLNIGNLVFFKYSMFLLSTVVDLGARFSTEFYIFLPLAISFYTFQLVAYAVDVSRGTVEEEPGFLRYALFILFFPQLIAGPIMRSSDFMAQIDRPQLDRRRMYDGVWLILSGIAKKVLLADPMGTLLAPIYREPWNYSGGMILLAGMAFSLQVYCDFSGYTDIARGSARLLGYQIPENFRAPFFARSSRELWQRWHITLASWLRDYIYFPLGGNRLGPTRTYINLIITFTLGGLWHGADYTYIAWGAFWGLLLATERLLEDRYKLPLTPKSWGVAGVLKAMVMFVLFSVGALMFRSHAVEVDGVAYSSSYIMIELLGGLFINYGSSVEWQSLPGVDTMAAMFVALFLFHLVQYRPEIAERFRRHDKWLILVVGALLIGWLLPAFATSSHQFIYFVF